VLPERSVEQVSRADSVHADTVRGEVERKRLRQTDPAELTRGVRAIAETAFLAGLRVDLDDHAPFLFHHNAGRGPCAEEVAEEVDLHHFSPFIGRELRDVVCNENAGV